MHGESIQVDTRIWDPSLNDHVALNTDGRILVPHSTTTSEAATTKTSHQLATPTFEVTSDHDPVQMLLAGPHAASLSDGAIMAIALSSVTVIVLALCVSRLYIKRRKKQREQQRAVARVTSSRTAELGTKPADHKRLPNLPTKERRDDKVMVPVEKFGGLQKVKTVRMQDEESESLRRLLYPGRR